MVTFGTLGLGILAFIYDNNEKLAKKDEAIRKEVEKYMDLKLDLIKTTTEKGVLEVKLTKCETLK